MKDRSDSLPAVPASEHLEMRRFRLVTAGLVLAVVGFIGLTRGWLVHPNLSLWLLLLMAAPFILDVRYPRSIIRD